MNPKIANDLNLPAAVEAILPHLPPCPYGAIAEATENSRRSIRRARPSGHGALTKKVKATMDAIAEEYRQRTASEADAQAHRLGQNFERETDARVLRSGGLQGRIVAIEHLIERNRSSAKELAEHTREALAQRNTAAEQANTVAGVAARRRRSWWGRVFDFLIRRTPNALCRRQLDHLERAGAAGLEAVRFEAAERGIHTLEGDALRLLGSLRDQYDAAGRAHNKGQQGLNKPDDDANRIAQLFPPVEERLELGQRLRDETGRVPSLARRALERHRREGRALDEIIREEAKREAEAAPLPSNLDGYLRGLPSELRHSHFQSLATEAKASLPVEWWEAPLSERHHWLLLALPGGKQAPFYDQLVGANPEKTPTYEVDNNGTSPDEISIVDVEVGLHPAQVPFLVDLRMRTPTAVIEKAMLWDGPAGIEDVDYELQARHLDAESEGWRRFSIGSALGLLVRDDGGWCRTTDLPGMNGLAQRRLAQGIEPTVSMLRSGEAALALAIAIENRIAALGVEQTVTAIDEFDKKGIPREFAVHVKRALTVERLRLQKTPVHL